MAAYALEPGDTVFLEDATGIAQHPRRLGEYWEHLVPTHQFPSPAAVVVSHVGGRLYRHRPDLS